MNILSKKGKKKGTLSTINYVGYGMCDLANNLAFSAISTYLTVFYTDVLKIGTVAASVIMIVARIWDAVNDPIMGFFVQSRKPLKGGKYRPYILIGGVPLTILAALCFLKVDGLSTAGYTAYAAVTYILYGMLYTILLVPYGSLASVMSRNELERSKLSVFRSMLAGVGNVPVTIIFPMIVFTNNVLDGDKIFRAMVVIAVIQVVTYIFSYCTTKENIKSDNPEKTHILATLKNVIHSKAFIIMSLIGCFLIAVNMFMSTVNVYLFKDYFEKSSLLTLLTVISYAPMVIMIPFTGLIVRKVGKKEINVILLSIGTAAALLLFLVKPSNPYVYMVFCLFENVGISFLMLEVWAMALDVVDYQEWKTGVREEASNFALFTFMRKIGQTIAACAPLLLGLVGYDSDLAGTGTQSAETLGGMYSVATLVPFILLLLMLILSILYPLNKNMMGKMAGELAISRGEAEGEEKENE